MKRILQAIIIALCLPTASFSMDFFGFEEGTDTTDPINVLRSTLAPISHIETQVFADLIVQHTGTRTAEICTAICSKIATLQAQHLSITELLGDFADELSEAVEPITTVQGISDSLELIDEIDVDTYESLATQLNSLKKNNTSILQDLQEISDILFPPVRIRTESASIEINKPTAQLPIQGSQEDLTDFYVGSYRDPNRKKSHFDS